MPTLKKIISRYMYQISCALVAIMLVIILHIQFTNEQRRAYESATRTVSQIEQVLMENQREIEELQEEYKETCLHNAQTVAWIIESDPSVLDSVTELKEIAESVEVDEIHIFDITGRIFTGTNPEYYNYTFDSGEQMNFFKPLLEDKTLTLVQEITPNTAEGKMMQYSALWSESGQLIVQIGMEPANVARVTAKNEISHLFSLLRVNPEANFYAIDAESGEIVGSTDLESVGRNLTELNLKFSDIKNDEDGFHATINGQHSFCVFQKIDSNYVGRVVPSQVLYQRVPTTLLILMLCFAAIAFLLSIAVTRHINKYVVKKLHDVNQKLQSITDGNLEETVDIRSSIEFSELSNYINMMVKSLIDNNSKMSYVLSKTNLYIGVYEYNNRMTKIRFTEYIPRILSLDLEKMRAFSSNPEMFNDFINKIRENPMPDEPGIYKNGDQYIRIEEIKYNDEVFGVVIDVTNEIRKRKEIESQRDIDSLTGLYNRRGLDMQLSNLFRRPEKLGHSAIIMIDADGLKEINDTYGHVKGDIYLKKIAAVINNYGIKESIAARQGGDEFILFLYDYDSEEELINTIKTLEYIQSHSLAHLDDDLNVPLRFSLGYCITNETTDYHKLIKEADERMYKEKKEHRKRRE